MLIIFFVFLNADLIDDFKAKKYASICNFNNITSNLKNEKILSLIGVSCVKVDRLYLLPYIFKRLKHTKLARKNSIYLLTIYMQKKLLYSYIFDNFSLKGFNLPDTDYIISHVFVKIKNKDFYKKDGKFIIKYKNKIIKVYKVKDKLFIDEFKNQNLIKRRWFR